MGGFIDLTGQKFGRLIVIRRGHNTSQGKTRWICQCECGNSCEISRNELRSGESLSCGCLRKDLLRIDIKGQRFGRLSVIQQGESKGKSTAQFWICKCDCGNEKTISSQHLRKRFISSCGCLKEKDIENIDDFKDEFFSNIDKTETCWNWTKGTSRGYGIFFAGKMIKAHRYSYLLHKGAIPKKMIICHKCDNPLCVNPEHLYAGTYKDNAQDRERRGRGRKSNLTR